MCNIAILRRYPISEVYVRFLPILNIFEVTWFLQIELRTPLNAIKNIMDIKFSKDIDGRLFMNFLIFFIQFYPRKAFNLLSQF